MGGGGGGEGGREGGEAKCGEGEKTDAGMFGY